MPVHAPDRPAEGAELLLDGTEIAYRRDLGIRLVFVVIDDNRDLTEPGICSRLERFPDLPFLELAVAGHDDDPAAVPGEALRPRHAVRLGDAHPERTGIRHDARRGHIGVSGKTVQAAEAVNQVEIELLQRDEQRVQTRRVVAL